MLSLIVEQDFSGMTKGWKMCNQIIIIVLLHYMFLQHVYVFVGNHATAVKSQFTVGGCQRHSMFPSLTVSGSTEVSKKLQKKRVMDTFDTINQFYVITLYVTGPLIYGIQEEPGVFLQNLL